MSSSIWTLRGKLNAVPLEPRAFHRTSALRKRSLRIKDLGTCPREENTDLPREELFKSHEDPDLSHKAHLWGSSGHPVTRGTIMNTILIS